MLGYFHLGISGRTDDWDGLNERSANIEILRLPIAKWIAYVVAGLPTGDPVTPLP